MKSDRWQSVPLKRVVKSVQSGTSVNGAPWPADDNQPGVLKTSSVYGGTFDPAKNKEVDSCDLDRVSCPVLADSLIVSRMNTKQHLGVAAAIRQDFPNLYLPDRLWAVTFYGAEPRFIDWWTKTPAYRSEIEAVSVGTSSSMQNISQGDFLQLCIELPDIETQRLIANYLDRETARIDTIIEEQERLIEMLRERRRSVISNAVARGLDESVVLKDAGLPGAGPVPAHWKVMPLRYTISFQEGPGIMAADFRDEGVPLLRVSSVRTARSTLDGCNFLDPAAVDLRWSHFRVDLGDLLISASASMGTVSEVTEETAGSVPYTGIIRIKPGLMHKDFIRWFVVSGEFIDQVESLKTGSTIQHFGPTHLNQMHVALPSSDEQHQIAGYLDDQTEKIDALIPEAERLVELARERRAALITAAVTGQIDVRERV